MRGSLGTSHLRIWSMNAAERFTIAKYVADYIIDTFLVEEAISSIELGTLASGLTNDNVSDKNELPIIAALATSYITGDRRVRILPRRTAAETEMWFTTNSSRI